MTKLLKISLRAIFVTSTFALAACSGEGQGDASNTGGYTAEDTKVAVEQCMESGANKEMCECVTKEVQAVISKDDMAKMEADVAAGKPVGEAFGKASGEAALKCVQAQVQGN